MESPFLSLTERLAIEARILEDLDSLYMRNPVAADAFVAELIEAAQERAISSTKSSVSSSPLAAGTTIPRVALRDSPFETIAAMFEAHNNQPMTRAEIVAKTGLSDTQIHTQIFKIQPKRLESIKVPGKKERKYRLLTGVV